MRGRGGGEGGARPCWGCPSHPQVMGGGRGEEFKPGRVHPGQAADTLAGTM